MGSLIVSQKLLKTVRAFSARISARLPARSTRWNEFGLTVFERAELAGG